MSFIGKKPADVISSAQTLADGSVTTSKIQNNAITTEKIAPGAVVQVDLAAGVAGNGPTFNAIAGTATSLSAGTSTKVNFTNEQWDTANCYDTGTSRFTPNVAGYYQISSTVRADIANASVLHIYVRKNGVDVVTGSFIAVTNAQNASTVSGLVFCNGTTDFIEIAVFSGAAGNTVTGVACTFQGAMIRSAT